MQNVVFGLCLLSLSTESESRHAFLVPACLSYFIVRRDHIVSSFHQWMDMGFVSVFSCIMNNANHFHTSRCVKLLSFIFSESLGVKVLGSVVNVYLTLQRLWHCFPMWLCQITSLGTMAGGSRFFIFLSTLVIVWLIIYIHSARDVKWYLGKAFCLHLPSD